MALLSIHFTDIANDDFPECVEAPSRAGCTVVFVGVDGWVWAFVVGVA